jgi:alcohol dehydrogenase class IV
LPQYIAASGGLDALSQAVESYWAVGSTEKSKKYSTEAIEIILPSIVKAVRDKDKLAMDAMAIGANLAGKAINISKTTASHAISYSIAAYLGIAHGHAVALTLGKFFIINSQGKGNLIVDKRGLTYVEKTMKELFGLFGCSGPMECCDKWYKLLKDIGLTTDLNELGVVCHSSNIKQITNNINLERLNNNPVKVSDDMLNKLLVHVGFFAG